MKLVELMTSAAVIATLAGPALAQETTTNPATDPATGTPYTDPVKPAPLFTNMDQMTVGNVLGMVVYDPEGDLIGEIDYVVGHDGGYAGVIGIGGFLGLGEYTVAIPLEDFELGDGGTSLTLNTTKESLKKTPEFDESGAESLPDETLVAELLPPEDDATKKPEASDEKSDEGLATDDAQTEGTGEMATEGASSDGTPEECPPGTVVSDTAEAGCVPDESDAESEEPATGSN